MLVSNIVCYIAVFSVVTQRSSGLWDGALRDDTKNGCVADYLEQGFIITLHAKRNISGSEHAYDGCLRFRKVVRKTYSKLVNFVSESRLPLVQNSYICRKTTAKGWNSYQSEQDEQEFPFGIFLPETQDNLSDVPLLLPIWSNLVKYLTRTIRKK